MAEQGSPRLFGDSRETKHRPGKDKLFARIAQRLDHCEFVHRAIYPLCRGCPSYDLCRETLDAVAEVQSQKKTIEPQVITMVYKLFDCYSALASKGDGDNNHV